MGGSPNSWCSSWFFAFHLTSTKNVFNFQRSTGDFGSVLKKSGKVLGISGKFFRCLQRNSESFSQLLRKFARGTQYLKVFTVFTGIEKVLYQYRITTGSSCRSERHQVWNDRIWLDKRDGSWSVQIETSCTTRSRDIYPIMPYTHYAC